MTEPTHRIASLLYPLTDFYLSAGRAEPRIQSIDGREMPEPYRSLLVHENDMTPTLEAYCDQTIRLRPLQVRRGDNAMYRQVVLVAGEQERPVEFGAIRIDLPRFAPLPRKLIEECSRPLGTILHQFKIEHFSRPSAFFAVEPDAVIAGALGIERVPRLYGRHNLIYNPRHETLAEVVEILPPLV